MSRYITGLNAIDEITILMKYLYMDENAYVIYHNAIGGVFKLTMNKDLELSRELIEMPGLDIPHTVVHEEETPAVLHAVIEQMKHEKPRLYPDCFKTYWEEVKTMTQNKLGCNYLNQMSMRNRTALSD